MIPSRFKGPFRLEALLLQNVMLLKRLDITYEY